MLAKQLQGAAKGVAVDSDFENVTLLLHGNGTNGAQNNTFTDGSSNAFSITRNGNTTQGTFSPYGDNWSNYFDGTGDYLSNTSAALITASVSTFTAEGWIYMAANPTTDANNISGFVTLDGQAAGTINYLAFGPNSSRVLYLRWFDGAGKTASGSTTLNLNQWYHIACVVNSNSIQFYVNGVAETMSGTTTLTNRNGTAGNFAVGANNYGAITGYISNLRVTTTAVYTAAFTPPTAPLTAITNTSLLTCQSNRFIDNSTNAFTITRNGDVSVQRFSPFSPAAAYASGTIGGSGYFDGTGDYLTIGNPSTNSDVDFGSGDFTIEGWVYPNGTSPYLVVGSLANNSGNGCWWLVVNGTFGSGGIIQFGYNTTALGSGTNVLAGSGTLAVSSWSHVAVTRSGSNIRCYVNGAQVGTTNTGIGTSAIFAVNQDIRVGQTVNGDAYAMSGYLSDVRLIKGTAQYTGSTYTIPSAPLTAVSNTARLLNFTNAGIIDNAMMNDLETVGNAQISTTQSKFGGSSMYFDGSGDYLLSPFSQDNRINTTGDFTIEFWAYFNSVASDQRLIGWDNNSSNFVIAIYTNTTGNLGYYLSSAGTSWNIAAGISMGSIAINTWYHIALVRSGSVFTPYINGVAGTTTTSSATLTSSTLPFSIGAVGNGSSPFNGYIDDLRITKGIARYTANFTAPTAPFADQ